MTPQAQNEAIGKFCNATPRVEWWAYKEGDGGSICMTGDTESEVQQWIDRLPLGSWAKDYKPKKHERYHDYCHDLNAIAQVEKLLICPWEYSPTDDPASP